MKLDRVVFCWDGHPHFLGMWPLVSNAWAKLGVKSTIFLPGDPGWGMASVRQTPGDARILQPPGELYRGQWRNWQTTMALLWGACQFPGETVMTSGVDQVPLSRRFLDALAPEPDDALVVGFAGVRGYATHGTEYGCNYYPSAYVAARSEVWRRVIRPQDDFVGFVRWAHGTGWRTMWQDGPDRWGMDEAVLSHRIHAAGASLNLRLFSPELFADWQARRIERANPTPDDYSLDLLRAGHYSEMHLNRPLLVRDRQFIASFLALP